jgi:hypothetical protein
MSKADFDLLLSGLPFMVGVIAALLLAAHLYTQSWERRRAKLTPEELRREDELRAEIQEELRMW